MFFQISNAALSEPKHLVLPGPWVGHIPFAQWLISIVRPRTLVELGTYTGNSYMAFCQAIVEHDVAATAYAVDTWAGDKHSGYYDSGIFEILKKAHDPIYGHFSQLLRMTFDEARPRFLEKSIDLLHIDGLHTYEAVHHDFETWLPTLSNRAVVLFHDTNVYREDFGVYQYWDELIKKYPSFNFKHSNGLGVLLVGVDQPEELKRLADEQHNQSNWASAMQSFQRLGRVYELLSEIDILKNHLSDCQKKIDIEKNIYQDHFDSISKSKNNILEIDSELKRERENSLNMQMLLQEKEEQIHELGNELKRERENLLNTQGLLQEKLEYADGLDNELKQERENSLHMQDLLQQGLKRANDLQNRLTDIDENLAEATRSLNSASEENSNLHANIASLQSTIDTLHGSTSWRLTAGVRALGKIARKIRTAWRLLLAGEFRAIIYHLNYRRIPVQKTDGSNESVHSEKNLEIFQNERTEIITNHALAQVKTAVIITTLHTIYVANAIAKALDLINIKSTVVTESPVDFDDDLYFVICVQMFNRLPPGHKRICFQMEQSVSSRWFTEEYFDILKCSLAVLDYSRKNLTFLKRGGVGYPLAFYAPIGGISDYVPAESMESDIDVIFYGDDKVPRRNRILNDLKREFNIFVVKNVFGENLQKLIRRSKVVVNIHYYENALLETTRIYECISLGAKVVSEVGFDQSEHSALEDVVEFVPVGDVAALVGAIRKVLQGEGKATPDLIKKCILKSERRFNFMLLRTLLGLNVLDYEKFASVYSPFEEQSTKIALSLPETTRRRALFEAAQPSGFQIFDGLRSTPGWKGCAMSYKFLASRAVAAGLPRLVICEDDVDLTKTPDQKLKTVERYLDMNEGNWDIFAGLIADLHANAKVLNVDEMDGITFVTLDKMTSTVYNVYSASALEIISRWNPKSQNAKTDTIDRFLEENDSLRTVTTLPFLVGHHTEAQSSIWGFFNDTYNDMIARSERLLAHKVSEFKALRARTSREHPQLAAHPLDEMV